MDSELTIDEMTILFKRILANLIGGSDFLPDNIPSEPWDFIISSFVQHVFDLTKKPTQRFVKPMFIDYITGRHGGKLQALRLNLPQKGGNR